MEHRAVLLREIPADQREQIANSAFAAAARTNALFGLGSHRYYESYFDHQQEILDVVVLRAGEPVLFMPLSGAASHLSYFGEPARIFSVPGTTPAHEPAYAALWSLLSTDLGTRYADLWMVEDDRLTDRIASRELHEIALTDLTLPEPEIRSRLRKSYKSLVNWGLRSMHFRVIDRSNADAAAFREFRDFHRFVANRITRSDQSWDIQFEMIRAGEAYAILGTLGGQLVAATLVIQSSNAAYYGVGAYDRTLMAERKPVSHASVFRAIQEARHAGLKTLILGNVTRLGDPKTDNISLFKRGFATQIASEAHVRLSLNQGLT